VIQNHLMQVIGFLAMEAPGSTFDQSIRDEQVKILRSIRPLSPTTWCADSFAVIATKKGVAPNSTVETFAAARLHLDSWRWDGVPFFIRAGKSMAITATEVLVRLRRPPLRKLSPGDGNYVRFRLGPDVTIALGARVKRPG